MKKPILLIIFNRPEKTKRVFDAIKTYRPKTLFIAGDGPRNTAERLLCEDARKIIEKINWECDVKTLFQEKNLGCKYGPITAIDWFFKNVEDGIILEDDCLPSPSFFYFCENLLEYYKETPEIMHISGNNFQNGISRGDKNSSYYFSKYTHSWGWATWKRAWLKFDPAIKDFQNFYNKNLINEIPIAKESKRFWIKNFKRNIIKKDSWDSLWMYAVWYNGGISVIPQKNLVKNIGFDNSATHTKKVHGKIFESENINNIIHPKNIKIDKSADDYTYKKLYKINIIKRLFLFLCSKIYLQK